MKHDPRRWLRLLARLADEPLKLSRSRLAEERAAAFSITTRGWALLAGEKVPTDTIEGVEAEAVELFNRLFLLRKLQRGRKEGAISPGVAAVDRTIRAEAAALGSLRGAVKKVVPEHQRDTVRRRQQRRRKDEKSLIELGATLKNTDSGSEN